MEFYLDVFRGKAGYKSGLPLKKTINCPVVTPIGSCVFVGKYKDGSGSSINYYVKSVEWCSDGTVYVVAVCDRCEDQYDEIVYDLRRDGFVERY